MKNTKPLRIPGGMRVAKQFARDIRAAQKALVLHILDAAGHNLEKLKRVCTELEYYDVEHEPGADTFELVTTIEVPIAAMTEAKAAHPKRKRKAA